MRQSTKCTAKRYCTAAGVVFGMYVRLSVRGLEYVCVCMRVCGCGCMWKESGCIVYSLAAPTSVRPLSGSLKMLMLLMMLLPRWQMQCASKHSHLSLHDNHASLTNLGPVVAVIVVAVVGRSWLILCCFFSLCLLIELLIKDKLIDRCWLKIRKVF